MCDFNFSNYDETKHRQGGYMLFEAVIGIAIASILIGAFCRVATTLAENRRGAGFLTGRKTGPPREWRGLP